MTYTAQPILASYISNIVPGTREADVDHLWTNLLAYYFPISENYGVEREAYIRSRSQTKANVCISILISGSMSKAIMVENKRASASRTGFPTPSSWTHAENQLLGYMLSCRSNQTQSLPALFGIVGIGRCVKFYRLRRLRTTLEDYGGGLIYNLDSDDSTIERIILGMKSYIATRR